MHCRDVMTRNVRCASIWDSVEDAAVLMRSANIGFLPVCDCAGGVVGALTDRDIVLRLVAERRDPAMTFAFEVMSKHLVYCHPDDDLRVAEARMARHRKSRVVVVDRVGTLVGVISLADVARHDVGANAIQAIRFVASREARS